MELEEKITTLQTQVAEWKSIVTTLSNQITDLNEKVGYLTARGNDEFLTVDQLAIRMQCNPQAVYRKINEGCIKTAGDKAVGIRIPMSQFYPDDKPVFKSRRKQKEKELTLQKQIFG